MDLQTSVSLAECNRVLAHFNQQHVRELEPATLGLVVARYSSRMEPSHPLIDLARQAIQIRWEELGGTGTHPLNNVSHANALAGASYFVTQLIHVWTRLVLLHKRVEYFPSAAASASSAGGSSSSTSSSSSVSPALYSYNSSYTAALNLPSPVASQQPPLPLAAASSYVVLEQVVRDTIDLLTGLPVRNTSMAPGPALAAVAPTPSRVPTALPVAPTPRQQSQAQPPVQPQLQPQQQYAQYSRTPATQTRYQTMSTVGTAKTPSQEQSIARLKKELADVPDDELEQEPQASAGSRFRRQQTTSFAPPTTQTPNFRLKGRN